MADYFSGDSFGGALGNQVLPDGDALKRKIDAQRETWLKGISTTKHGKKEDPTYLHFRFIFDFGETSFLDEETFLAPSPIFRNAQDEPGGSNNQEITDIAGRIRGEKPGDKEKSYNIITDPAYQQSLLMIDAANRGNFYTGTDFFYGSKFFIKSRAEQGAFNMNGGGVGYMGAQEFLGQRSVKRKQMLKAFKKGLKFVNEKCPYYFQSVTGLDTLLKIDIKNLHKEAGKPYRMGTLTIDCLESIDMRMFSLSELYRKAIYDYTYHRVMLPENLRKFRMWLVVSEIRNIQLSYGINDILNPFSIPSVAQGANFLDSFNSQTGLLNNTEGLLQKSTSKDSNLYPSDKFGSYTLGPYAFIYQFDQCEFDFDDSYPSYGTLDNKGGSAVNSKFKIHVGRVKDYKIQFNALADVMQKDDNVKNMVLSDVWGSRKSPYDDYDYAGSAGIEKATFDDKADPKEYFTQLASNFITNSVADLKEQGVTINGVNLSATSLQGALLGNIYGFGGISPASALRSAYSVVSNIQNFSENGIPNPFADNSPQARGLGGPIEREEKGLYRNITEDINEYKGSVTVIQNLGTAYNGSSATPPGLDEDVYPTNPGTSLGLPDREYPKPGGDEYKNVPGSDLGVPGRVYPLIKGDVYPTNPGTSLGLPDRQYPEPGGDEYTTNPGSSLGVPDRVYPELNDDVYPENNPEYPTISDDVYTTPPQPDTQNIGDVYSGEDNQYPEVTENQYEIPSSTEVNNIGDVYEEDKNEYSQINEKVYEDRINLESAPLGEVYDKNKAVYGQINDDEYKDSGSFKEGLNEDVYKTVPGRDLGAPGRNYNSLNSDEYKTENSPVNVSRIGRIYPSANNENN